MVFPKWILVDKTVFIGKVNFHSELVKRYCENPQDCKGGGWFSINLEKKIIFLYGFSIDFGRVSAKDMENVTVKEKTRNLNSFKLIFLENTPNPQILFDDNIIIHPLVKSKMESFL